MATRRLNGLIGFAVDVYFIFSESSIYGPCTCVINASCVGVVVPGSLGRTNFPHPQCPPAISVVIDIIYGVVKSVWVVLSVVLCLASPVVALFTLSLTSP